MDTTTFDIVGPITEGMGTLVTQATAVIGAVAPGAISIAGAVLVVTLGLRIFRSLVR